MSNVDVTGTREEGLPTTVYVFKVPRRNHDAMVQNQSHFTDYFKALGCNYQSFQLNNAKIPESFTSIAEVVSVGQDEEVWLVLDSFIDAKHRDDFFSAQMENDETIKKLHKQWMNVIVPGSCYTGDFVRPQT